MKSCVCTFAKVSTAISAKLCSASVMREFVAKCGDSLRELEEWSVPGSRDIDGQITRQRES
jgi:succinate dehydrogenase/fumarate reductase flavoprotein subunit